MLSDTSILSPRVMQSRHVNQRLERILDSLNAANIAVYPVDPSGLPGFASLYAGSAGYRGSGEIYWERMARASQEEAQAQAHGLAVQTMEEMAHMTGGVSYHDSNDISGALARASEDSAAYYLLGYYVSRASTKPGWHKLKGHVKQLHLSVRARSGYFLMATSDFTPDEVRARDISNAIGSPLDLTGISILARILPPAPPAGEGRVYFELYLKGLSTDPAERNHLNLQVVGLVSDGKLHEVTRVDQTVDAHPSAQLKVLQNGMLYKNSFALAPGEYSVKFVVRDNLDGHLGSLSMPLTVH